MKRKLRFLAGACLFTATALFSGCSSDDDFLMDPVDSGTSQTRAVTNPDGTLTITFDDFDPGMLAGPTSTGENLYSYQGYPQVTTIYDNTPEEYLFLSMFNTVGGSTEYSSGGIALSNWNIRSNQSGNTGDWWYSYLNQCSVYNTAVEAEGQNKEAGHSGSNFGVVYGYVDAYNQAWMAKPEFYFNVPRKLVGLWICNTSYTYGVITYGNQFGSTGVATPLKEMKGYFQVNLECYDANGGLIRTYKRLLADYRNGQQQVDPITTWDYWEINAEGVQSVKFNFEGSDSGAYGLNTPAYICIDDITIQ